MRSCQFFKILWYLFSHVSLLPRSVFELEMQCVMQAAVRDGVRNQCVKMEQHARDRQEALRNLRSQWQSITDFRRLVVRKCTVFCSLYFYLCLPHTTPQHFTNCHMLT